MPDVRVKAPVSGPDYSPLPAVEYDYGSALILAVGANSTATPLLPSGLYRLSCNVDCCFTFGAAPVATVGLAGSDFSPYGSVWHEFLSTGDKKMAAIAVNSGETGYVRIVPAKAIG